MADGSKKTTIMTLFNLTIRELLQRRVNFLLGVFSVGIATVVLSGSLLLLNAYDLRTNEILAAKQADRAKGRNALVNRCRCIINFRRTAVDYLQRERDNARLPRIPPAAALRLRRR